MTPHSDEGGATLRANLPRALLFLVGLAGVVFGAIYCFFWVFGSLMASSFGVPSGLPSVFEYALVLAPLVTFASYIWIALRPWKLSTLVVWGVIAHLPFLRFFPYAQDHLQIFVIVLFLILAILVYVNFVWSLRPRTRPD
ncbi:MAG: hypothetical protein OES32_00885 [Acidobacteriota bacterium]|nr:hypothetical protein [Acidobacteriota bacterium]